MLYQLKKQLFFQTKSEVSFHETCHLSGQYTPENLWNAYRESFFEELSEQSTVLAGILRGSDVSFSDGAREGERASGVMHIAVPDSFINRKKCQELGEWLETLYSERYSFPLAVHFEYIPIPEKTQSEEYEFVAAPPRARQNSQAYMDVDAGGTPDGSRAAAGGTKETGAQGNSAAAGTGNAAGKQSAGGTNRAAAGNRGAGGAGTGDAAGNRNAGRAGTNEAAGNHANGAGTRSAGTGAPGKNKSQSGGFGNRDFSRSGAYGKGRFGKRELAPADPDVFYGRPFDGEAIPIAEVQDEIGEVILRGKIIKLDVRELKNEKLLYIFSFTDFTDTISAKLFVRTEQKEELDGKLAEGSFIKIKGMAALDKYDHEISIGSVDGIRSIPDFVKRRKDNAPVKRVELHAHTTFSDMDAVVSPEVLVNTAFAWGHPAIAITDHGVVQAFPVANHAINIKKLKTEEEIARAKAFKIIYGMEAYLVDDLEEIVREDRGQELTCPAVVFDIETTGLSSRHDRIIEIGAVTVADGEISEKFSSFVNPQVPIPFEIEKLTSISDAMVMDAETIEQVLPKFLKFCEGCILVAHNASFDTGFIAKNAADLGLSADFTIVDTVGLARVLLPELHNFKLDTVAKALGVSLENHHRAVDDAGCTAEIYVKFLKMLSERGYGRLRDINEKSEIAPEIIRKMPTYHAILLCRNDIGRVNLYRMVSASHIEYFQRRPRIPKSMLAKHREGLLVGSACEAGELYQALLRQETPDEVARLCDFYDYYEIQPLGNNRFMIENPKLPVESEDDLIEINKRIIALGEQ
ncbi:MAG: PHP domain-containing protein, partial [Lachnospiraceae bacterium]|nr:PHP domain-containing protein [Lachnospiraceae bacterium]